jgi:multidrug efflux pump subunit AcrA (membrane-fusion protein)
MMFISSDGMGTLGGKIEAGSTVWSNMSVLQVPDMSLMQVSCDVSEVDYKRIEKGQMVNILIEAADNLSTTGIVKRKSLVGRQNRQVSSVKSYEVIVSVDSCHLKMTPGMSAKCQVTINEIHDTIVVPSIAINEVDSSKVIYVAAGDKFIPVQIQTGTSNSSETIISSGLKGDEIIALTEPSHKFILTEYERPADTLIKVDTTDIAGLLKRTKLK